jgi:hypothetical protein
LLLVLADEVQRRDGAAAVLRATNFGGHLIEIQSAVRS